MRVRSVQIGVVLFVQGDKLWVIGGNLQAIIEGMSEKGVEKALQIFIANNWPQFGTGTIPRAGSFAKVNIATIGAAVFQGEVYSQVFIDSSNYLGEFVD